MEYKLVAVDLDGTLLDENYRIGQNALDAIACAAEAGVAFTIATGRMHDSAAKFARLLGLELPIISYNGSVIRAAGAPEEYRHLKVPRDSAAEALSLVGKDKALRYAFLEGRVLTDTPHEWTDNYAKVMGVRMECVEDLVARLNGDPTMIVFMCDESDTPNTTEFLSKRLDSSVRLTNSNPWFVDVLNKNASKADALKFLANRLGISMKQTIAIGDSWNDLEMLEAAGLGVAVANAAEKLKVHADYVTRSERGLGVVEVLEKFVNRGSYTNSTFASPAAGLQSDEI